MTTQETAPVTFKVGVKERCNLGNFEFVEVTGEIEFTEENTDGFDPGAYGRDALDALLLPHRRRAEHLLPEESESFLAEHPALEES